MELNKRVRQARTLKRAGAVMMTGGLMLGVVGLFAPTASANGGNWPKAFAPDNSKNTFTPPVQDDPENCNGIIPTPGSEPASKTIVGGSLTIGGTVEYKFFDDAHANGGDNTFAIHDCVVVYPADHFSPSDFDEEGNPVPGSEPKFKQGYTEIDQGMLTGIGDNTQPVYYFWTVPNDQSLAGQWICNFAKDTGNNHGGGGNRKTGAACFQLPLPPTTTTAAPTTTTTAAPTTTTTAAPTTTTTICNADHPCETTTTAPPQTTTTAPPQTTTTAPPETTTAPPQTTTTVPPTTTPPTTVCETNGNGNGNGGQGNGNGNGNECTTTTEAAEVLGSTIVRNETTTAAPPTTKKPAAVLGEQITRSPGVLPFTGSNTRSLLLLAALAMLIGGVALLAAERQPAEE